MIELSVVIPIMNEAPNLVDLHREITGCLEPWGRSYEVIIVDDGSTDDSFQVLSRIQASDARWRVIRFRRNFGQTAAFSAGFAHARGRFIPAIASEQGVRIAEVVVNHRARRHGTSKYGISRTVRVVLDLLTVKFLLSYSTRPVQIFGLIGLAMGLPGAAILAYLAAVKM